MSTGGPPAIPVERESTAEAAIEIDVDGRWDALAASELLIDFHSFLVQHTTERRVVNARPPGRHGEPLADALLTVEEWQAERRMDGSVPVAGRPYGCRR